MQTRLILKPGQAGTKKLVEKYGDRLVCVRYRYDPEKKKRYKTVELVEAEADWEPAPGPEEVVGVQVAYKEIDLRQRVKAAGGRWNPQRGLWEVRYLDVVELGLESRMVRDEAAVYEAE